MLQCVADCLTTQFSQKEVYRIGGDEFVVLPDGRTQASCEAAMQQIVQQLEQDGYSIAYGIAAREQEQGLERVIEEADEVMLGNKKDYYASRTRRDPR